MICHLCHEPTDRCDIGIERRRIELMEELRSIKLRLLELDTIKIQPSPWFARQRPWERMRLTQRAREINSELAKLAR